MKLITALLLAASLSAQFTPPPSGGGGTPGGTSGEVQSNQAGAFHGDTGLVYQPTAIVPNVPASVTPVCASGCTHTWAYSMMEVDPIGASVVGSATQTTIGANALDTSGNNQNNVVLGACKRAGDKITLWLTATTGSGSTGVLANNLACGSTWHDQTGSGDGSNPSTIADNTVGVYGAGTMNVLPALVDTTNLTNNGAGYELFHFGTDGTFYIDPAAGGNPNIHFGYNGGFGFSSPHLGIRGGVQDMGFIAADGAEQLSIANEVVTLGAGTFLAFGYDATSPAMTQTGGIEPGQVEADNLQAACFLGPINCADLRMRHLTGSSLAPTVVSGFASGSSTITGSDIGGSIVIGTTPTNTGVIGFGAPFISNPPACTVNDTSATPLFVQAVPSYDSITFNAFSRTTGLAANFNAGSDIDWTCIGKTGIIPTLANVVMVDGDSITNPDNLPYIFNYPSQSYDVLTSKATTYLYNEAVPGSQTSDVLARNTAEGTLLELYSTKVLAYSLMIGTNNLYAGTSPASTYADIQAICSAMVTPAQHIIIFTVLPRSDGGTPGGFETNRQTLNTLIKAGSGGACAYTVADIAADMTIGQAGDSDNATYYIDKVHLTKAGSALAAPYLTTALATAGIN